MLILAKCSLVNLLAAFLQEKEKLNLVKRFIIRTKVSAMASKYGFCSAANEEAALDILCKCISVCEAGSAKFLKAVFYLDFLHEKFCSTAGLSKAHSNKADKDLVC